MAQKIYLEPAWKLHATWNHMVTSPPDGYEFVLPQGPQEVLFQALGRWNTSYRLLDAADGILPAVLVRAWLQRWEKPPANSALTYAHGHLVFRPEPWVVEVEYAHLLLGPHPRHLKRFQGTLERMLASPYCRKILCWSQAALRTVVSGLHSEKFRHKVEAFPLAVPPRRFTKEYQEGRTKLLFVGSAKILGKFEAKGGREVLETFALLRQCYPNLELVFRSDLPAEVKAKYGGIENLRIMDKAIPWEELERQFQSADIFILPSHSTPPFVILDAMSYELPVVTIDAWANAELVADGVTGLVAPRSRRVPYYYGDTCHPNYSSTEFDRAIHVPDPEVVAELAKRVSLLIEDPELRRKLGKAARHEVEDGKFSIATIRDKLKRLFDEAIAGDSGKCSGKA